MKISNLLFGSILGALVLVSACKPDDKAETPTPIDNTPATTGNVTVQINHTFGSEAFNFTSTFKNPSDSTELLTFSSIQYILSNFRLQGKDGVWYNVPETYFYINQKDPQSLKLTLKDVTIREYTHLQFLIGVDSLRNVSGVQTGGLDPATGMFWSWNTGYIFFKLEGDCPKLTPIYSSPKFVFHIGGFKPPYNSLVWADVPFGNEVLKVKDGSNTLKLQGDVMEVFQKPIPFKLTNTPSITLSGTEAMGFSLNYVDMFSLTAIQ